MVQSPSSPSPSRSKWLLGGLFVVLAGLGIWALAAFLPPREVIAEFVAGLGPWGPVVSVAINIAQVLLAPFPGQIFNVVNAYVYGFWLGTLYSLVGMLLGSWLAMSLARRWGRPLAERLVGAEQLEHWDSRARLRGPLFFFLVFLLPLLPDDLICFVIGLSPLPIGRMLVLCAIGRLPGIFATSWIGAYSSELSPVGLVLLSTVSLALGWLFWHSRQWLETTAHRVLCWLAPRHHRD